MKPILFLPPGLALLASGIWLGLQHQSLSKVESQNSTLRERIEVARHAGPAAQAQKGFIAGKNGKQGAKKIDWKELAMKQKDMERGNSIPDMRAMIELQKALLSMSAEELVANLDEIAALDIPEDAKAGLLGTLIGMLAEKDPKLVLEKFGDRMGDERSGMSWQLTHAFQRWAEKDSAGALAWLDAQIAAGKMESKSLSGDNDVRQRLEGSVITSLIASDPGAAAERLARVPEGQRAAIFQGGIFFNMKPGSEKAVADLIRSQIPEAQRDSTLANSSSMLVHQGGYERVGKFLTDVGASASEREAIVAQAVQSKAGHGRDGGKLETSIEEARAWAMQQAPGAADRITGQTLGNAPDFAQASALALKYHEQTGNDDVLVAFLQGGGGYRNAEAASKLVDKISDPAKREELRKKFSAMEAAAPTEVVPEVLEAPEEE